MIIFFKNNRRQNKNGPNGFNKIGYVTTSGTVIFATRNRVNRRHLSEIEKFPHQIFDISNQFNRQNLDIFFSDNLQTLDLFNAGLGAIQHQRVDYFLHPKKYRIQIILMKPCAGINWPN
jgi:hypothetical protein